MTNKTREPEANRTRAEYITQLANSTAFPEEFDRTQAKDPVDFYTEVLSEAEDQSVTIIAIGFATNLFHLYYSKDGPGLIKKKVKELVVQGGSCDAKPHSAGYNQS